MNSGKARGRLEPQVRFRFFSTNHQMRLKADPPQEKKKETKTGATKAELEKGTTLMTNLNAIELGRSQRRTSKRTPNTRMKLKQESIAHSKRNSLKIPKAPILGAHSKIDSTQTSPKSTSQRRENQGICLGVHVVPDAKRISNGSRKIAQVMEHR